ncbi:MAG: type II toxin-antitoxin system VapC family toxin [Phycisphaerae bacterium]|nr:type II toxin-antitoxin system VapC family toxin [Gemmatimonadaceae bacterium]
MKILDLNLLIYAMNVASPLHASAKDWLETLLSGEESIALPWIVVVGFLRVTTHPRVLPRPLTPEAAMGVIDALVERPHLSLLSTPDGHWTVLRNLIAKSGTAGNLATDAHLAAIAIQHDAELCSADSDFGRFAGLRWTNPLADR